MDLNKPDANSPEAILAATRKELESAKSELATLKASAAPEASAALKAELATAKKDLATAQTEKTSLQAALTAANARLAAKGEAPSLTFMQQVRQRANENAANAEAAKLAAKLAAFDAKRFLSAEDKTELHGIMATLPEAEKRNFWIAHLRGK